MLGPVVVEPVNGSNGMTVLEERRFPPERCTMRGENLHIYIYDIYIYIYMIYIYMIYIYICIYIYDMYIYIKCVKHGSSTLWYHF